MPAFTPIYGFRYPLSTDPVPVMPSDMEILAEGVESRFDSSTGGKKIVPTPTGHTNITFDSRGNGTPSTGVSTFTVNNVFTNDYKMYRIHWLGQVHSGGADVRLSFPSITSQYYGGNIINRPNATTPVSFTMDNNNSRFSYLSYLFTTGGAVSLDVYSPAESGINTSVHARFLEMTGAGTALGRYIGFVNNTSAITSFVITMSGNTITTAGRVTIYGYTV